MDDKRLLSGWMWRTVLVVSVALFLLVVVYACAVITRTVSDGITL